MSQKNNVKFQKKISDLEKFIGCLLESPMKPLVKKKILDDLHHYKAKLITESRKPSRAKAIQESTNDNIPIRTTK